MGAEQHETSALKSGLKRGIKRFLGIVCRPQAGSRILTYHSVGSRPHEMNVTPARFREQMQWLSEHTHVITLEEAAHGEPGVAVTFDDGYYDNLVNAQPVLCEFRIPATVFVVAGRVGGMLDHDRGDASTPHRLMSWEELRILSASGIAIGAHSMTHRRLSSLTEAEQRTEVFESARLLRDNLGVPVDAFAYPFGTAADFDATTVRMAQEAGFALAVSNRYGPNRPGADLWSLRRIWIDATDTLDSFRAKVDGRLDALRALDSGIGMRLRRLLNRAVLRQ